MDILRHLADDARIIGSYNVTDLMVITSTYTIMSNVIMSS